MEGKERERKERWSEEMRREGGECVTQRRFRRCNGEWHGERLRRKKEDGV